MSENTGGMKVRYRIKTEDEFIDEYGRDWKHEVDWCIHGRMDYLLGKEVDKNTEHQIDGWWIHEDMIIEITEDKNDPVKHPCHYTDTVPGIECIQVTQHFNFNRGNAIKYIWRAGKKGNEIEDLQKAKQYIEFEIERLTKQPS